MRKDRCTKSKEVKSQKSMLSASALTFSGLFFAQVALGSGYPSDYCHQNVRLKHDGAALWAHVSSGCDSAQVIGYKGWGYLAKNNPDRLEATVVGSCGQHSKTTIVSLGKEWNGTGYMSHPLSFYDLKPRDCDLRNTKIWYAVSDGSDSWDPGFGGSYGHFGYGMYGRRDVEFKKTNKSGHGRINDVAWREIVEAMRR